jgi:NRPS condensation-like uncharacterized protein
MINLNHTIEEVNVMLHALSHLAYKDVAGLIDKLKGQAEPQVQAIQAQQQTQVQADTPAPEQTQEQAQ